MIEELNLPNDHIVSITDTYNEKNITVDGYDFCDQINKLKQSKYKFLNPQSVIDLSEASVVETQQNEFEAEKSSELNFDDLEGYLDELPYPNDF